MQKKKKLRKRIGVTMKVTNFKVFRVTSFKSSSLKLSYFVQFNRILSLIRGCLKVSASILFSFINKPNQNHGLNFSRNIFHKEKNISKVFRKCRSVNIDVEYKGGKKSITVQTEIRLFAV